VKFALFYQLVPILGVTYTLTLYINTKNDRELLLQSWVF